MFAFEELPLSVMFLSVLLPWAEDSCSCQKRVYFSFTDRDNGPRIYHVLIGMILLGAPNSSVSISQWDKPRLREFQ